MNNEFIAKTEPLNYNFPVFGGNFDTPAIMLAKKDKTIVGSVDYTDLCFTFNLNAFQTVTFKIYRELDGKIQKYFDSFEDGMLIVIPGISWYEIHVETDTDNSVITKAVTGTSLECKLCDKRLFDFQVNSDDFEDDDYARTTFYNPLNTKKSLLNRVLNVTPNWKVGHVDQSLMDMQRTFDESDIDVYSFLTGNVAEAFNCLFVFDTFDCTVNAYDLDNYGNDTKIFVDSENLVTNMTQKIDENSIITCYRVVGGDYVEIAEVNPNGSNKIYNFSYCLSQMPQEIQNKINAYNTKFQSLKPQYEDVVVRMQNQLEIIQELYTRIPDSDASTDWTKYGLELLQNREKSYQNVQDVYCAQGMNNPQSLNYDLYQKNQKLLNGVKAEIGVRETEIENAQNVWKSINGEMLDIQGQLDMNKWFSEEEWKTLDDYVIEATYSNDNFSIFDNTSEAELLSVEKELYDAAWNDLSKKCRPKYQYSATLMNLLAMKEFKELAKHFKLGNFIRTKTDYGELIKLRIISFTVDYSKAGLIDVTFSDATKVDVQGVCDDTADILAQAHSSAMSFKFNKDQYDNSVKQGNFVSEMRKNGLDVAITNIHNSSNQSQVWDETGMTFRQWNVQKNDFDPEMIKIINNQMVFSDDGLKTARMALGKIALGNGEYGYGLNAEVLMSKIVMSENLYLENNSGTYKFTDDGFIASNGSNSIKIQPNKSDELFSLYKGDDRNFYIDSDGDIWLRGNLSGGSINIGNGTFTVDPSGNMVAKSGIFVGNGDGLSFESNAIINNMSSSITQNANAIQTEVSNRQSDYAEMSTKISQTAEEIRTEVINRQNSDSELLSSISQTSEEIRTEVSNRQNADNELSTQISQTSEEIKSEVTRATNAESLLSSSISQTADSISAEVKARENADKTISASLDLKINKNDDGTIISLINGSANRINFNATNMFTVDSPNFKVDGTGNVKIGGEFIADTSMYLCYDYASLPGINYATKVNVMDIAGGSYSIYGISSGSMSAETYSTLGTINPILTIGKGASVIKTDAQLQPDSIYSEMGLFGDIVLSWTKGDNGGRVYKCCGSQGNNGIPSAEWVKDYVTTNMPNTSNFATVDSSGYVNKARNALTAGTAGGVSSGGLNGYSGRLTFSDTTNGSTGQLYYKTYNGVSVITTSHSSRKIKHDIKDVCNADLDPRKLYDLKVVQFKFNNLESSDPLYEKDVIGLIAEDVAETYPLGAEYDENGNPTSWWDRYLIPPMLYLIQEQHTEIESLKQQNISLEGRIAILEQHNQVAQNEVDDLKQEVDDLKQLVNKLLERDSV